MPDLVDDFKHSRVGKSVYNQKENGENEVTCRVHKRLENQKDVGQIKHLGGLVVYDNAKDENRQKFKSHRIMVSVVAVNKCSENEIEYKANFEDAPENPKQEIFEIEPEALLADVVDENF